MALPRRWSVASNRDFQHVHEERVAVVRQHHEPDDPDVLLAGGGVEGPEHTIALGLRVHGGLPGRVAVRARLDLEMLHAGREVVAARTTARHAEAGDVDR